MNAGAVPKIMARTSRDIAGYFFTNVDIFFSLSDDWLAGTVYPPAMKRFN
jgi:hypothetical protein